MSWMKAAFTEHSLDAHQRRETRNTRLRRLSPEMESVVTAGYSDFGWAGPRSDRRMKQIRAALCRYRLLFSCVPLLGASDEDLYLYYNAFRLGLCPSHAINIVEDYRQRARLIADGARNAPVRVLRVYEAIGFAMYNILKQSEYLEGGAR